MPVITGTIEDSSGLGLTGRLTVTLDGLLVDTSSTPDSIMVPKPREYTITSGVVNIDLVESQSKNLTYRFVFETSETTLIYYLQSGVVYTGPKNFTSGQWWTGSTFVNGTSQLLTEEPDTKFTTHFDFRAIVPSQPTVEFSSLVPTGLTTDILDTGIARLAQILTSNIDYIETLRGGPKWRGAYNNAIFYQRDDAVLYGGSTWVYINNEPAVNQTPSLVNTTYWQLLASKGDAGGTGGNDAAYDAVGWNGATDAPSRNAVRDIIETLARATDVAALAPLASPVFTGNPTATTQLAGNRSARLATTQFVGDEIELVGQVPIGAMMVWTTLSAPAKWIICDGRPISRTGFPALFALIGTSFGAGNGTTTFNIPDLRGRAPVGMDSTSLQGSANRITAAAADALGGTFGSEGHILTVSEMPNHTHSPGLGTGFLVTVASGGSNGFVAGTTMAGATTTSAVGGGTAHNNVQPSIFFNWIIYAGV